MWIVSQDKREVVNTNNVARIKYYYNEIMVPSSDTKNISLGVYSSPDKASKVMEMILDKYSSHYFGSGGQMATSNEFFPPFGFIPPKVFYMPKEEDVKE